MIPPGPDERRSTRAKGLADRGPSAVSHNKRYPKERRRPPPAPAGTGR